MKTIHLYRTLKNSSSNLLWALLSPAVMQFTRKTFLVGLTGAVLISLSIEGTAHAAESDFGYPFTEIAKSSCRKEAWSTLGPECKMPLPRITGADYNKYAQDTAMRRVYSVLWGATYDYGWDTGIGSHLGVDIVTSAGTPVIAISNGRVLAAGFGTGWGNYVTLEHTLSDGVKIYSNYAHLSVLNVAKGDAVAKGTKIGEVGNTGNSYGNHLHFQIDVTDQLHPYYYVRCGTGKNPLKIVNTGDCRSSLTANTIDPIIFLETGNRNFIPESPGTPQSPTRPPVSSPTGATIEAIKARPPVVIERSRIKSREELLEEEAQEYLKGHRLSVALPERGVTLGLGSSYVFEVESRDLSKNLVTTNLPGPGISIEFDSKKVTVFPEKVNILAWGKRAISITPKTSGLIEVKFKYGKTIIGTGLFEVLGRTQSISVARMEIKTARSLWLGGEQDIYLAPLTQAWGYVGAQSYKERFVLESIKGKAKFCRTIPQNWVNCNPGDMVESLEFGAADTVKWYLSARIILLSPGESEIRVRTLNGRASIASKRLTAKAPLALDRSALYYDAIIASINKNILSTRTGYIGQDQTLTTPVASEIVDRVLAFRVLRSGSDIARKKRAIADRERFTLTTKNLPQKSWTRAEFADLLLSAIGAPRVTRDPVWNDESGPYQKTLATLRSQYNFRWQDQFGKTHFQVDKLITRAEAAYLIEVVLK
jgi:hypothetical protein